MFWHQHCPTSRTVRGGTRHQRSSDLSLNSIALTHPPGRREESGSQNLGLQPTASAQDPAFLSVITPSYGWLRHLSRRGGRGSTQQLGAMPRPPRSVFGAAAGSSTTLCFRPEVMFGARHAGLGGMEPSAWHRGAAAAFRALQQALFNLADTSARAETNHVPAVRAASREPYRGNWIDLPLATSAVLFHLEPECPAIECCLG